MRLTSSARLRIVTISVVAILTAGIGLFSTLHTYNSEVNNLDATIENVTSVVQANSDAALGAALFQIDNESLDLLLILHSHDGTNTVVRDTSGQLSDFISKKDLDFGIHPYVSDGSSRDKSYRWATVKVADNEILFIAGDTSAIHYNLSVNLRFTLFATLIAILLASIVFSFYIRRVRNKDDADALARMQEFLGDASHELRTPLTVIKGYIEMLSKGQIQAELDRERAFNRVGSEINRMEYLIHDLLLLAELGESAEREMESVDISEILAAHSADFETLHPQRQISIEIEPHLQIIGSVDYISRYIQNALTNIGRHTPQDAPVKIALIARNKKLYLSIEDGGPGLPESSYGTRVKLLNRFDKSRSRDKGGSGLGMSIMSGVIEKLGGTLTLRKSSLGGLALDAELPLSHSG